MRTSNVDNDINMAVQHAMSTIGILDAEERMCIIRIAEEGGKYEEGTGKALITLVSPTEHAGYISDSIVQRLASSRDMQMALHILCIAHIKEMLGCKDTSLDSIFADGFRGKLDLPTRTQQVMARIEHRKGTCGDSIPQKLSEGKISVYSYSLMHNPDPFQFDVSAKEAENFRFIH